MATQNVMPVSEQIVVTEIDGRPPFKKLQKLRLKLAKKKHNKAVAALLTVALGPFGVHRLYLGTSTKVPIIYSITLGAFFILPLVDLVVILLSKDLARFENDERVIMWAPKKEKPQIEHSVGFNSK